MLQRRSVVLMVLVLALALPAAGLAKEARPPRATSVISRLWQAVEALLGISPGARITDDLGPTTDPDGR